MLSEYEDMPLIYCAIGECRQKIVQVYAERCKIASSIETLHVDRLSSLLWQVLVIDLVSHSY